ncbi:MAG: anti-sigma factor family protein [Planctomycetota bacterium]|jgi:anti-sigma factor RsiW
MSENGVTFEQLAAYASGDLDGAEASVVESYLAAIPSAEANVARLREVIDTMRTDDAEPPTAEAVRRALAVWADRRAGRILEWLRHAERVVAEVVYDNRQRLAMPGFRGAASTYQSAYECPCGRVDLQILRRPRSPDAWWRLRGQVSPVDAPAVGSVAIVSSGTEEAVAVTTPDRHGRFKIDSPPGVYDLLVELDYGERVIVAPRIAMGTEID